MEIGGEIQAGALALPAVGRIDIAAEYRHRGFLPQAIPLADPTILPALLADEPLFSNALDTLRAQGRNAVPYRITDAIRTVAHDPAILAAVEPILKSRDWVMWGANIRRATPNQAHAWHVDLESLFWPTITVAVGLAGCTPQSATWCIPGTHRRQQPPPLTDAEVLAHGRPEQIAGFADGRFYIFDARTWHRGDPDASRERTLLFLHYHRATEPRIPLMADYILQTWTAEPAPYFANIPANRLRTDLAEIPFRIRLQRWIDRMRSR